MRQRDKDFLFGILSRRMAVMALPSLDLVEIRRYDPSLSGLTLEICEGTGRDRPFLDSILIMDVARFAV